MGFFKRKVSGEQVVPVPDIPRPDSGVSAGYVQVEDWRLVLSYLADAESNKVVVAKFNRPKFHSLGEPNDEALAGHPLSKVGLGHYGVFLVEESSLIGELRKRNSLHPRHIDAAYSDLKHWVFTFKEDMFECVASDMTWEEDSGDPLNCLQRAIMTDPLTKLPTHRAFPGVRPIVPPEGIAAVTVDIADMIWVNDYFGFPKGDETLVKVAKLVEERSRSRGGTTYRFGGEEFLVLLPGASIEVAKDLAKDLVEAVRSEQLEFEKKDDPRDYVAVNAVVMNLSPEDLDDVQRLRDRQADRVVEEFQRVGRRHDLVVFDLPED